MRRRTVLAAVPPVLLAGCTDVLTQQTTTFEADRGVVGESARSETNYTEVDRTKRRAERTFADKSVIVVNKLTEYARTMDLPVLGGGKLGRFTVLTSPEVTIVPGEPANPIADMDNDELAMTVQEKYDAIDDVSRIDGRQTELLGDTVDVGRYRADAETDGRDAEVHLHIAKTEHARSEDDTDFVVCVGVNPSDIDERDRFDRLMGGVDHPA